MLSLHELESHFQTLPGHLLEIVVELRNLVQQVAPGATEAIRRDGLVYFYANRGGLVSAGICQILVKPDHVRLAFNHGAFLPDPAHLLEGETRAKRYTRIDDYDQACWEELKSLIEASSRFDPYTHTFITF